MCTHRQVTSPHSDTSLSSSSSSSHPGPGCLSKSKSHARYAAHCGTCGNFTNRCRRQGIGISVDKLPDDVLLEIFDFYVGEDLLTRMGIPVEVWRTLVHVCRRWRNLVFRSPCRLKLRLVCTTRTPTRNTLDVWPALPLIIYGHISRSAADNITAALERRDRVRKIDLKYYVNPEAEKVWAAMQEPLPELTHLWLEARGEVSGERRAEDAEWFTHPLPHDVPNSFLGGSAPRLQFLRMNAVGLLGLQKLLLSATRLIDLRLSDIPDYISSQRMITCLSALTSLQTLSLAFEHYIYPLYQGSRSPSSPKRTFLPALKYFQFTGVNKYLEDLVAGIDVPELNKLSITFSSRHFSNTPELTRFISRTPKLGVPFEARIVFHEVAFRVSLPSQTFGHGSLNLGIASGDFRYTPTSSDLDSQLSSLVQVCASSLPSVSTVDSLYIHGEISGILDWHPDEDIENTEWLELLRPFIALKNLYLFEEFTPRIASALEDLDESSMTELLPSLQSIFLQGLQPSGAIQDGIRQFVAARRLTSHPIAVFRWDVKHDETWY